MKVTAPDHIIKAILEALETNIHGRGLVITCDIKSSLDGNSGQIEFIPKAGHTIKTAEWFWLGYFVREYVD